jgi:hypothetical protein
MNERIKEFMRESGVKTFFPGDPGSGAPGPEGVYFGLTETQKLEKFAELIVKECQTVVEWAISVDSTIDRVPVLIKEHFGVEE